MRQRTNRRIPDQLRADLAEPKVFTVVKLDQWNWEVVESNPLKGEAKIVATCRDEFTANDICEGIRQRYKKGRAYVLQ